MSAAATTAWAEIAARLISPPAMDPGWEPQPKQQRAIELASKADETLYGGAAGGGKTEWLINYNADLMEHYPGNRGVIFRRVYPSLNRSVVPRARTLLANRARWNGNDKTFTFPNGSVLELGSLQYKDSVIDYQGAEYGVISFEEITEFLQSQWEFLIGRLRAPAPGIRPHAIATTNPGGVGHRWVKRRWIKPKPEDLPKGMERPKPMQVWTPASEPGRPQLGSRVFVPSTIEDNPKLMERDPGYLERLRGAISDRGLRQALVHGDWDAIDAVEGALWKQTWLDEGRARPDPQRPVQRRVVAVDPSDGDETGDKYGVAVVSLGMDGVGYIEESYGWYATPAELARKTTELARDVMADAIVVEKNHGGKWLKQVLLSADRYANVQMVWASENKKTRAEPVAALFQPDPDREPEIACCLVGHHEDLEEQMTTFTGAKGEPSPDELDAVAWGVHYCVLGAKVAESESMEDDRLRGRR